MPFLFLLEHLFVFYRYVFLLLSENCIVRCDLVLETSDFFCVFFVKGLLKIGEFTIMNLILVLKLCSIVIHEFSFFLFEFHLGPFFQQMDLFLILLFCLG